MFEADFGVKLMEMCEYSNLPLFVRLLLVELK